MSSDCKMRVGKPKAKVRSSGAQSRLQWSKLVVVVYVARRVRVLALEASDPEGMIINFACSIIRVVHKLQLEKVLFVARCFRTLVCRR